MVARDPEASSPLLGAREVVVGYGRGPILPAFTVSLRRGELWALVGRNGSGKTTVLRTLAGVLPAIGGTVERAPGARFHYSSLHARLDDTYPLAVEDVVALGRERAGTFFRPGRRRGSPEVSRALERLRVSALSGEPFRALSDGQKQRVLVARLVAANPDVALLDEPTSALDAVAEREVLDELVRLRGAGMTLLVVSHAPRLARELADRVLFVDRGAQAVVSGDPRDVLDSALFRDRYGGGSEETRHA